MWESNANCQEAWVVDGKRNDLYVEEEPWNRDPTIDALATMVARKIRYLSSRLRTHTSTDAKHRPPLPMQSSSPKAAGMTQQWGPLSLERERERERKKARLSSKMQTGCKSAGRDNLPARSAFPPCPTTRKQQELNSTGSCSAPKFSSLSLLSAFFSFSLYTRKEDTRGESDPETHVVSHRRFGLLPDQR